VCAIPYGNETICPVTVLQSWLEAAGFIHGPVFRQISKNGEISDMGISPGHVNITLKSIAQDCNLPDAECYSAHSLRRGFATQASKSGAPFGSIMQQGRWRHEGTVLGYIQEGKRFEGNAVKIILKISD
jgi:integrase